jgi:peptidoglycan/LPS O-acetylase OafA/YrhL
MTDSRNLALDGVRGLAALSVAFGHCLLLATGLDVWRATVFDFPAMTAEQIAGRLLFVFFPSNAAVMVFFALSGYVLWASFIRKQMVLSDFPDYLVARVFRLLPLVMVSALAFSVVLHPGVPELVANMLLLSISMNGVTWSLQVEMIASIVIFVAWLSSRNETWKLVAILAALAALVPFARGHSLVVYLPAFILGALIHHVPAGIWRSRALLWIALATLLTCNLLLSFSGVVRVFEILTAVAVVGCVAVQRPAFLQSRAVNFLGAVSYPFYLIHPLGMAATLALVGTLPGNFFLVRFAVVAAVSIAIGLVLAWLMHIAVEMPALRGRPRVKRWAVREPPAA